MDSNSAPEETAIQKIDEVLAALARVKEQCLQVDTLSSQTDDLFGLVAELAQRVDALSTARKDAALRQRRINRFLHKNLYEVIRTQPENIRNIRFKELNEVFADECPADNEPRR